MRTTMLASLAFAASLLALGLGMGLAPTAHAEDGLRAAAADGSIPLQDQCGDGRCQPPEDCNSCSQDCGSCCGDGRCAPPEDCNSCSRDCGSCCGDGRCAPPEDHDSCPRDC